VVIAHAARGTTSAAEIIPSLTYAIGDLRSGLGPAEFEYLEDACPNGTVVMRGTDVANRSAWARIEPGDLALIAWNGHIRGCGEVVLCKESAPLATLRGPANARYRLLYLLRNTRPLEIPYATLNRVLGARERNNFQRFAVFGSKRGSAIIRLLGNNSADPSGDGLLLPDYALQGELDGSIEVRRRREQGMLRRFFFKGRDEGECGLCGKVFPVGLLVAAHIKKRSRCSDEEKRDVPANVIPACRFGCDELFERGYIVVGEGGVLERSAVKTLHGAVDAYIGSIEGRQIANWRRHARYFAWHVGYHSSSKE
jgi:hypothetical protein